MINHGDYKEVSKDWRKTNVTLIFKNYKKEDAGNYRLLIYYLIPGKMMEQLILETISRHNSKKIFINSPHGFIEVK